MPDLNYLKSILNYDPDTGIFIWKVSNSNRAKAGNIAGCLWINPQRPEHKYYRIMINGKLYRLHRIAYYYITGIDPAEKEVDHKNGNTLNNRFENLRLATLANNRKNRKENKNNTSGFKGVVWNKPNKKWQAQITLNNKQTTLGYYKTKFYAALVYARAAKKYFGEFRRRDK